MAEQVEKQSSNTVKTVESMEEFDKYVQNAGDKLVVVDFHAQWCGPCKMIAPKIEEMAKEMMDTVIFLKVDVDECGDIAEEYRVEAMPTFQFFKKGEKVDEFVGANFSKLKEKFTEVTQKQVKS